MTSLKRKYSSQNTLLHSIHVTIGLDLASGDDITPANIHSSHSSRYTCSMMRMYALCTLIEDHKQAGKFALLWEI